MKKFFAVALLAMVVGLGTPAAFADGSAESPGMGSTQTSESTVTTDTDAGSTGYLGSAESPGYIDKVLIYLGVIL